jgi:hypothetical protein
MVAVAVFIGNDVELIAPSLRIYRKRARQSKSRYLPHLISC